MLRVVEHALRINKLHLEVLELVGHVLLHCLDAVVVQIPNLAERSQELSRGRVVQIAQLRLSCGTGEDTNIGHVVVAQPFASLLTLNSLTSIQLRRRSTKCLLWVVRLHF